LGEKAVVAAWASIGEGDQRQGVFDSGDDGVAEWL
jgi:hypothetical protein